MKKNRQEVDKRHTDILEMVRKRGEVRVEEITHAFQISAMTVRRDLKLLEEEGLLVRTHGGAMTFDKASRRLTQDERVAKCRKCISEYAAQFVADGDRIFINGSLTALNMLDYVKDKKVHVVTNNCQKFGSAYPDNITIWYTGGEVRNGIMIGEYVMRNLLDMRARHTFLGCAAVYDTGEFRYDIPTEIGINEVMISRTEEHLYILADHSKIQKLDERETTYGSCTYDRSCTLITDEYANAEVVERLRKLGIDVILVPVR